MAAAIAASAAVVLSAPFAQQAFTLVERGWPGQLRTVGIAATAVPAALAIALAASRIRERRPARYLLLALALTIAGAYIVATDLSFAESFHFVEYGLLGVLFYRACRLEDDASVVMLPLAAGVMAGTADEWFQWFIPIRAGEARDVLLNGIAVACGILLAVAVYPPARFAMRLEPRSRARVIRWCAAAAAVFVGFFWTVHVGHEIRDPEVGRFLSRFTAPELARAAGERAERWRERPPIARPWISREDQYLSEGLWRVQQRNRAWDAGDAAAAWRENRILEKFYAPVLDAPTYAGAGGQRWPPEQRRDAEARAGAAPPRERAEYPYPLYVWPRSGG